MLGDLLSRIGEALRNLAGGRKALFAIITLVTLLVMNYAPGADPARTLEFSKLIGVVVGVAILGITIEDSVKSWTESGTTGLEELLRAILDALQGKYDVKGPAVKYAEPPVGYAEPQKVDPRPSYGSSEAKIERG